MTNGIPFPSAQDYVDYIQKFKIGGVGISGGEPFLTNDRTMLFVTRIKKQFGPKVYLWMYTNGNLVTEEKLKELRDAGLDEIRFDITANQYRLDKVQLAAGILKRVTVEIPAIPEDFDLLKGVMRDLKSIGVRHLNLHQLRSTPHNCKNLIERNYTFLHGAQVTVLESELTALRIMNYASQNNMGLPINYCSVVFKDQYQTMGHRKRIAPFLCEPYEGTTPIGLIRRMAIKGETDELENAIEAFRRCGAKEKSWHLNEERNTLSIDQSLLQHIDLKKHSIFLTYYVPILTAAVTYRNVFKEIPLNQKRKVILEKAPKLADKELRGDTAKKLQWFFLRKAYSSDLAPCSSEEEPDLSREEEGLQDILRSECIKPGLQDYY